MVTLVTLNAAGSEVTLAEDGAEPTPADGETRVGLGLGDVAALVGFPPLAARTGLAAPFPPKTATAATLTAATPAATPSGSPHLRDSEVC
ncbi:hypothetical protein ACFC09_36975 [Streptomyces sp. NPDC056161]|uniref:hypothetical protein n=1 Tax=Streptomyces sp. NPDC056161 TaxID=3345732 RepID=UPI0035D76AAA